MNRRPLYCIIVGLLILVSIQHFQLQRSINQTKRAIAIAQKLEKNAQTAVDMVKECRDERDTR